MHCSFISHLIVNSHICKETLKFPITWNLIKSNVWIMGILDIGSKMHSSDIYSIIFMHCKWIVSLFNFMQVFTCFPTTTSLTVWLVLWVTSAEFLGSDWSCIWSIPSHRQGISWVGDCYHIPTLTLSFTTFVTGTTIESLSLATTLVLVLPFRPVPH